MTSFKNDFTTQVLPKTLKTRSTAYVLTSILTRTIHATLFIGHNVAQPDVQLVLKQMPRSSANHAEAEIHKAMTGASGVVPLLDTVVTRQHIYLVLPFYRNGDLFDMILGVHESTDISPQIREAWAVDVFAQMVEAVTEMHHRGVYHRDLKAENFLVDDYGRVLIADFGLATRDCRNADLGYGSEFYMSPESFAIDPEQSWVSDCTAEQRPQPAKSDVWSLGILLLNLLRGRNPWPCAQTSNAAFRDYLFEPEALKIAFGLSNESWLLISRMLCPDVEMRADMNCVGYFTESIRYWLEDADAMDVQFGYSPAQDYVYVGESDDADDLYYPGAHARPRFANMDGQMINDDDDDDDDDDGYLSSTSQSTASTASELSTPPSKATCTDAFGRDNADVETCYSVPPPLFDFGFQETQAKPVKTGALHTNIPRWNVDNLRLSSEN